MFCIMDSPEAYQWPCVGKYKVDVASFESLVLPELKFCCFRFLSYIHTSIWLGTWFFN